MAEPGFWDNAQAAQEVIDANNALKAKHDSFYELQNALEDLEVSFDLLQEEPDADLQAETEANLTKLQDEMQRYELNLLLAEPYDGNNAILEIHPGAGGTEAKIGVRCCCECISVGLNKTDSRWKLLIIYRVMKPGSRVSPC